MAYILEPEVAGGWGDETEVDTSCHPPKVRKLIYKFEGWLGDELLETFPCFIISQNLANLIKNSCLTGYTLGTVTIIKSEIFLELYPDIELPHFYWLQVNGAVGVNDFAINNKHFLQVSDAAFNVLSQANIGHCGVVKVNL